MSPSPLHEILVALFRERPALAQELLLPALGDDLPRGAAVVGEASFTQIAPAEFTADLVIVIGDPPELGVIVEVQLSRDEDKRYSWPLYAIALRARRKCPTVVLVVAPDPAVAAWAAEAIVTGPGGSTFRPHVVGLAAVPVVTSPEVARGAPELGVLSGLAHGDGPQGEAVLLAMLAGLKVLHDDVSKLYYDFVLSRLTEATRRALEDAMNKGGYEYQSDFARKYVAQGLAEGEAKGLAEGEAKGLAEGKAQEACRLVMRQLARRFGLLGQDLQERVEALDLDRLEALAEALLDFGSVADLQDWLTAP